MLQMDAIIPQLEPIVEPSWQAECRNAIKSVEELLALLHLSDIELANPDIMAQFPLRVPRGFVARMQIGDAHDPLLRQVIPLDPENRVVEGFVRDPLNERQYNSQPGLIQKYDSRVLLTLAGSCAINCRYCFRRHFPYNENLPSPAERNAIYQAIADDSAISEVIFSGGDPLLLSDERLGEILKNLNQIPHLKTIRFHSRIPVVLPSRLNESFFATLESCTHRKVMVIHSNHPNEFGASVRQALKRLQAHHVRLYNQSVLLRGVNDQAATLIALSECLEDHGVNPYYLHLMDRVANASHFVVELDEAQALMRAVAAKLPGYLVPKLVRETPGMKFKEVLAY